MNHLNFDPEKILYTCLESTLQFVEVEKPLEIGIMETKGSLHFKLFHVCANVLIK